MYFYWQIKDDDVGLPFITDIQMDWQLQFTLKWRHKGVNSIDDGFGMNKTKFLLFALNSFLYIIHVLKFWQTINSLILYWQSRDIKCCLWHIAQCHVSLSFKCKRRQWIPMRASNNIYIVHENKIMNASINLHWIFWDHYGSLFDKCILFHYYCYVCVFFGNICHKIFLICLKTWSTFKP